MFIHTYAKTAKDHQAFEDQNIMNYGTSPNQKKQVRGSRIFKGEHFKKLLEYPQRDKKRYYFHEYDQGCYLKRTKGEKKISSWKIIEQKKWKTQ